MHENFCVSGTGEGLPSPLSLTFWGCVGEGEVEGGGYPLGVEERWQQSSPNGQLNVL